MADSKPTTSLRKIEANRINAQMSTGPKTDAGKVVSRLNAVRHGLLAKEVLLPGEDGVALSDMGERLRADLRPVGELENIFVDKVVSIVWRLRRALAVEVGVFKERAGDMEGVPGYAFVKDSGEGDTFSKLSRYETALDRALFRVLQALRDIQEARQLEAEGGNEGK